MPGLTDIKNNWQRYDIRLLAVIASLVISLLTLLFPDSPNDDAYIYIRTAEIFLNDGLAAAYQHYSWATYSILIAIPGSLGIDLFTSALSINGLFFALLVYSFLGIISEINESKLLLLLAAISILVYPELNEYRYMIIRDTAFWALSVFALWQLLLYARLQDIKHGVAFCFALLFATAFRAEAIAYLLIAPLSLLFDTRFEKPACRKSLLRLMTVIAAVCLPALLLASLAGVNIIALLLNFFSVYEPFISSTFNPDASEVAELSRLLFSEHAAAYSQEYMSLFIFAGLLAILAVNLIGGIGGAFLLILFIGLIHRRASLGRVVQTPVFSYLLVNLLLLFVFVLLTRFLTSRYAVIFLIMLALYVPLITHQLLESSRERKKQWQIFFLLFFVYCSFDSYYSFGSNKDHVFDSIEWIADNGSSSGSLYTNNHAIAYFSGRIEDYDNINRHFTAQQIESTDLGDWIAVELDYTMGQLFNSAAIAPYLRLLNGFPMNDDPKVAIYERVMLPPLK